MYRERSGPRLRRVCRTCFLAPVDDPLVAVVRRYARAHGPFPTSSSPRATESTRPPRCASSSARARSSAESCFPAAPSANGATPTSCAASAAPASPACGGKSSPPTATSSPASSRAGRTSTPTAPPERADRLREALVPLQGVALTPKVWERDVLPRRLATYSPAWLDELCTSGEVVWVGAGALGRNDGKVALYFREDVRLAGPPPSNAKLDSPRATSSTRSASGSARGPASGSTCSSCRNRPRSSTRRSGISPGRARRPTTPSRRCERRGCAPPSSAALRQALFAPPRRRLGHRARALVADRAVFETPRAPALACAPRPS